MNKVPVGVSECLLGRPVRFDAGHKLDPYLTGVLGDYLAYHPTCPEVAIGLGVPREPVQLVATDSDVRVQGVANTELDVTDALRTHADAIVEDAGDLCGYIFMQKSPSCGVFAMKRYDKSGSLLDYEGRGAYAGRLMERMPWLPVEEAGRLESPVLRDSFLTRVFTLYDWKQAVVTEPTPEKIADFLARHKYLIMAHRVAGYAALSRLLVELPERDISEVCEDFIKTLMEALSHVAGRNGNANAMNHMRGLLRWRISAAESDKLIEKIAAYHRGEAPLIVPLTRLKQYLSHVEDPYLHQQSFWEPYPAKLSLRHTIVEDL
jgi:uncharacterized protein YbgA (DUF1722 family)/uncharacterized protein YbbK (DUF523 family)